MLRAFFDSSGCWPERFEGSGHAQRPYFQPPSLFFEGVVGVRGDEGQIAGHENLDTKDRLMAAGAAVGGQRAIRIDLIIMGSPYQAGGRESIDRSGKG
jgi:hypothetical protein